MTYITIDNATCDLCSNNYEHGVEFTAWRSVEGMALIVCTTCLEELVRKEIEARVITKAVRG